MGLLSQTAIVAVPTSADAWVSFPNITVPETAKRISKVKFSISPDPGTSATSIRMAPVFQLIGSGIAEQNPHEFLGSFGGWATVTAGGIVTEQATVEYDVDIPVARNAPITAQVKTFDEAITAGTCTVEIQFDSTGPRQAGNSMSHTVDAATAAAADAYSDIGNLTVPVAPEGRQPTKIIGIAIGVAIDNGTSAVSLRTAPRVQLTGAGIKGESLAIELEGPVGSASQTTDGTSFFSQLTRWIDLRKTPIYVNPGGIIKVEQKFDVEIPTAGTIAVMAMYA